VEVTESDCGSGPSEHLLLLVLSFQEKDHGGVGHLVTRSVSVRVDFLGAGSGAVSVSESLPWL